MNFNFSKENLIETEKGRTLLVYWLKRVFIDDWVMKLVALIITFALWLGVTGLQETATRTLNNVALNPLLAKDLEITNDFVKEVDVEITGDQNKVDNVNPRDLVVTYDVTDLADGEREVHLTTQDIKVDLLPSGVTVTKISPENIVLKIEKTIEAEIPVLAETKGNLANGYEVYSVKSVPEKVRVRGPQSFVETLSYIPTDEIDLSGRRGDFVTQKVPINVGSVERVSLVNQVTTSVAFRIGKKRIERLFVVSYETENKSGKASVTLYGEISVLENLSSEDIQIIEDQENSDKLRVLLPEDVQNSVEIRKYKF